MIPYVLKAELKIHVEKAEVPVFYRCIYLLPRLQQKSRFDFEDELKIGDVRYKHLI